MEITLMIIISIMVAVAIILIIIFRPRENGDLILVQNNLKNLHEKLSKIEADLKEDFRVNRAESASVARENRTELNNSLKEFKTELSDTLKNITEQNQKVIEKLNTTIEDKFKALIEKTEANLKLNRVELTKDIKEFSEANVLQLDKINNQAKADSASNREAQVKALKDFQQSFEKNVTSFNELQKEKFGELGIKQTEMVASTEKKLEQMRETVDEKLQKTLNERLGQSFETVGKQLQAVQEGLGEMKNLAQDVGGLKRVLSNVKMRGGIGEVQLAMLLEQVLAPDQYEANVKTKGGSNDIVEFAIKLPGKDDHNGQVWLPVDAKFPKDIYEKLQEAYEGGDLIQIDLAQKVLEATIKKMAKDICDKYIDPPNTTDFAVMFLPFEGIYAEVVRKASLLEDLHRNCKVIVTGPTTLAAILNSLQMGFKTLAIQKRSSEVWQVLGAVKKEFENFGGMMEKAQKNIQTGLGQLDDVMGKRTRAIQKKLKSVEALGTAEAQLILPELVENSVEDGDD